MHLFHIRSVSGFLLLLLGALTAVVVLLLLPAAFFMVLWNALIYEGFKGPEISLYQGFLAWGIIAISLKLLFQPEIRFEIQSFPPRSANNAENSASPKSTAAAANDQTGIQTGVQTAIQTGETGVQTEGKSDVTRNSAVPPVESATSPPSSSSKYEQPTTQPLPKRE